jgi:ADP-ribose pyrophosphatase YjhB (NUDIX family)
MLKPAETFRFCPRCAVERSPTTPPDANPFACRACGWTYYFNPTLAAAVFIRRPDGKVLFIRRARDPGRGRLAPPGGFIDAGERAEDAVRREVREEVGLEIGWPSFLASFPNEYPYRDVIYPVLDFFFVAETASDQEARALDDVEDFVWRDPLSEVRVEDMAFPSMQSALALWQARLRGGNSAGGRPG